MQPLGKPQSQLLNWMKLLEDRCKGIFHNYGALRLNSVGESFLIRRINIEDCAWGFQLVK
jgi:hypothetical protein